MPVIQPNGRNATKQYSIYRPKALQHYLQEGQQTILPPLVRPRTFLFLWLLLGVLLVGGSLAWLAQIPVRTAGFAVVAQAGDEAPQLICFMPADALSQLYAGQQLLVRVSPGGEYVETEVQEVKAEIVSPYEVQTGFGLSEAAAALVMQPSAVVHATLPAMPSGLEADALLGSVYSVEVTVGSRPILSLFPIIGPAFAEER